MVRRTPHGRPIEDPGGRTTSRSGDRDSEGPAGRAARRTAWNVADRPTAGSRPVGPRDPFLVCRFLLALPDHSWLRRFSSEHRETRLEILHRVETEDGRVVDDVRLGPRENPSLAREIAGHPDVLRVENLKEAGEAGVYRVTYRLPSFVHTVREFGIPPRFPLIVQDGTSRWTFILRASSVDPFVEELRSRVPSVEVETFRPAAGARSPRGLTPRQREVFHRAMRDGYFDVPRRVTLTDLARRLGVSKSTLSESLAIAERKLLEGIEVA